MLFLQSAGQGIGGLEVVLVSVPVVVVFETAVVPDSQLSSGRHSWHMGAIPSPSYVPEVQSTSSHLYLPFE